MKNILTAPKDRVIFITSETENETSFCMLNMPELNGKVIDFKSTIDVWNGRTLNLFNTARMFISANQPLTINEFLKTASLPNLEHKAFVEPLNLLYDELTAVDSSNWQWIIMRKDMTKSYKAAMYLKSIPDYHLTKNVQAAFMQAYNKVKILIETKDSEKSKTLGELNEMTNRMSVPKFTNKINHSSITLEQHDCIIAHLKAVFIKTIF